MSCVGFAFSVRLASEPASDTTNELDILGHIFNTTNGCSRSIGCRMGCISNTMDNALGAFLGSIDDGLAKCSA